MSSSLLAIARETPREKVKERTGLEKMPAEISNLVRILKRAPDPASFAAIDPLEML